MRKTYKIILINLLVFVGLLVLIELLLALSLDLKNYFQARPNASTHQTLDLRSHNKKAFLPNYDSYDWAYQYYVDANRADRAAYASYIGFKMKPFQSETINIDSSGFRVTPSPAPVDAALPKAVFLGGSTMYGAGSADGHTIPAYFAGKQNQFQVVNFGQPAYLAYQSFILLQLEVTKGFRPKLVITYDGVNNAPVLHKPFAHLREVQFRENLQGADQKDRKQNFYSFKALRQVLKSIKTKFSAPPPETIKPALSDQENEDGAVELLESWLSMKKLCNEIDADFICILQPHAFVGKPDLSNLLNSNYKRWHRGMQDAYHYYDDVLRLIETDRYQALKPHFLDLTAAFDHSPNIYVDFCHVSPNGNEIIAEAILSFWLKTTGYQ